MIQELFRKIRYRFHLFLWPLALGVQLRKRRRRLHIRLQGELDSKNKALFFFTPGAYSIVLIFANFRPRAYSVVLIYISAEPVPIVLISGI